MVILWNYLCFVGVGTNIRRPGKPKSQSNRNPRLHSKRLVLNLTFKMIVDKPLIAAEHAFNLPDPTPKLLELIHAEPTLSTINAIVIMYIDHAKQFLSQVDKLVGALANLKTSTITFNADARHDKPTQLSISQALKSELHSLFSSDLAYPKDGSVSSSNGYLSSSVLAAKTVKISLCPPHLISGQVDCDLNYENPENGRFDVATHQVRVLCACLLLTICGSHLLGQINFDPSNILNTLERIKNVGVVQDPHGQQLLEVCNYFDRYSDMI
jgi:hypothetical protein